MAEVASWLAMRPVYVRCANNWEAQRDPYILNGAAAYVRGEFSEHGRWIPGDHAVVAPPHCDEFMAIARAQSDGYEIDDLAFAVLVLTHESGHLRGWRRATLDSESEASTERWALRHVYAVARRIGLSHAAAAVVLWYAAEIHKQMSPSYLADDCRKPYVTPEGRLAGCGP